MTQYVVFDIGCLECHNPSDLIGIYTTRAEALATGATPAKVLGEDDWRGEGLRVVFEYPTEDEPPTSSAGS